VSCPRPGLLTVAVLAPTVVLTAVRGAVPGLQPALERDPDGLRAGELWRLLSPVLVQPDPPSHGAPLLAGALLGLVLARDLPPPDTISR
jgi:hypothetical protein